MPASHLPVRCPQSIDFGLTRAPEGAAFEALLLADTQPESDLELGYLRDDIVTGALASAPPSASTTATWCSTICRSIRATCRSWVRPAFPGTIAPATTT